MLVFIAKQSVCLCEIDLRIVLAEPQYAVGPPVHTETSPSKSPALAMATCMSLSGDESDADRAPDNFNIASTHENDGIHWPGECVMKCPMCKHLRKSFHCRNCVRDGDFVPSKCGGDQANAVR